MACKPQYKGIRYNSLEELYNANGVNEQQKQKAQQIYSEYLSQNPNGSVEGFKSWVDNNQSNIQYQKQIDLQAEQDSVLEEFANSLSEKFNISFDLISEEEAKSISSEYDNEPAFFDPKTKKAYLVKGKANKTSAIHEIFTHPFLLQIEKTNPTLYKNLLKEAKNNKSVVDYVDNFYGTNKNNDHEYIARAIDLAVQGELDQQKDKTLLERIQDFFNQLYDYLKKLFNIPQVFSSAISPNITLQQLTQFAMYGKGKMNLNPAQENIEYSLKATSIIVKNLDKIKQWEKNKSISEDVLWKKIQELQVPKEQLELIKNSEGNTVEEKLLNFTNQYSYAVEINISTKNEIGVEVSYNPETGEVDIDNIEPDFDYIEEYDDDGNIIGMKSVLSEKGKKQLEEKPTQHYSYLTVPGGINYTENAHVIPAMKGKVLPDIYPNHDQEFANGDLNMYGWDRSDDKAPIVEGFVENKETPKEWGLEDAVLKEEPKTRRILEIQSKFQKWRLNFEHKGNKYQILENEPTNNPNVFEDHYLENGKRITGKEYNKIFKEFLDTPTSQEDAFIKLIAKQWETLMIKSIIQDSAKKGYEKVLFPTSEVVSQIQKFDEAAEKYSNAISKLEKDRTSEDNFIISEWEKDSTKRTIKGTLDFYNNLRNTLDDLVGGNKNDRKKGIYKLQQITDEYGNTWNEVTIDENRDNQNIVFQKAPQSYSFQQFQQSLNNPNTNPILQSNQQEQVKKFNELQERLNNKEFLEGAKNAFESSEELQNVAFEALVPKNFTRLYRAENEKGVDSPAPSWVLEQPEIIAQQEAQGRWFYKSYEEAKYHADKFGSSGISYIDVPTTDVENYNARNNKFAGGYGKEGREYFVSKELANNRKSFEQQKQQALNAYTDYIARVSLGIIKNPSSGEYNYESQVKDIVYHGTDTKFESFDKTKIGSKENGNFAKGFNFIGTRHHAKQYSQYSNSNIVLEQIIDLKNPFILTPNKGDSYIDIDNLNSKDKQLLTNIGLNLDKFTTVYDAIVNFGITKFTEKLKELGYDGFVRINNFSSPTNAHEYIVFEPEQTHILGSKQDVEGFREFVSDKNNASKENNTIVGKVDIDYTIPIFENPNEFSDEFMNHC